MRQRARTIDTVIKRDERIDEGRRYIYELSVSENLNLSSYRIPLYSVSVSMTDTDGESTSSSVKDAFADAGRALVFYEKIVTNWATPIDLAYILEDEMR